MSRTRLTWQKKKASPPPQIPAVDRTEKGEHPAYYSDPEYGDFAKGDPDAWAETPTPPPYLETSPPNVPMAGQTEEPDHPAYPDLETMPPSTPVTAKQARLYRQAAVCQYIATKLQEQAGRRVPMNVLQSIERKASKRQALTSTENTTWALVKDIERQAAQLMDLPYNDLLKTAATLGRASDKDSALARSARRDWALFNKMAAEMEEEEDDEKSASDDEDEDEDGKQAFFDEILAEAEEEKDDDKKDKFPFNLEKKKEAKSRAAHLKRRAEDEKKDDEDKDENPFAKKEARRMKRLQAALALFAEEDDSDDEDASKKAEDEDEEEKEEGSKKEARRLLAKYLKLSKKADDDDDDDDDSEEDEEEEEDNPFASKKARSKGAKAKSVAKAPSARDLKLAALAQMLKIAEDEDEEEEDETKKEAKVRIARQAQILDFVERQIIREERSSGRGKRADASEVAQTPFAGLVDDVIAEDQDGDGVDQNESTNSYSSKKALFEAMAKLDRKASKRKAQKQRQANEVELQALLSEINRLAEDDGDDDDDDESGKTAMPEAQVSVAPRNPNGNSGAGGNLNPEKAPITPEVSGPQTRGTAVTATDEIACPEDMMDVGMYDDPMEIMDLGIEEGNALDSAMMPDDVDPADLVDFELMAEVQAPQAKQAKLRPQPKKPSAGARQLGRVAHQVSEVDDLSQLWGSVPDVRSVFGMPKTY